MSHPHPALASSVVCIRVNYSDVDRMGLLHHAAYLRYFERCREEFSRRRGGDYGAMEDAGWLIVVVDVAVKYRLPARYDDVLALEVRLVSAGHASIRFDYEVRREGDGALLATASTRHAFVDREGRVRRLDAELVEMFQRPEQITRRGEVG
ncbi:MAG: thioesterase family protein [Polyangiales bacterium]